MSAKLKELAAEFEANGFLADAKRLRGHAKDFEKRGGPENFLPKSEVLDTDTLVIFYGKLKALLTKYGKHNNDEGETDLHLTPILYNYLKPFYEFNRYFTFQYKQLLKPQMRFSLASVSLFD